MGNFVLSSHDSGEAGVRSSTGTVRCRTRVLILGVNSFIGNHLTERLLHEDHYEVYGLEILLSRLKMEHLSYHIESLLKQAAKKELNYREFLCIALQQEWNGRHQRGMESRLKQARLPWVKTLEQFDFTFQPDIDCKVVRKLAGLAFVERSENVILLSPPSVGKNICPLLLA